MPRRRRILIKYGPEGVVQRFIEGVRGKGPIWERRTIEGGQRFLPAWYQRQTVLTALALELAQRGVPAEQRMIANLHAIKRLGTQYKTEILNDRLQALGIRPEAVEELARTIGVRV